MQINVAADPAELAAQTAEVVANELAALEGPATLGLAGGSTPRATYGELGALDVAWSDVTLWLGDERWVPADHPDSNAAMARATLADVVGAELLAPATGGGEPAAAAHAYEIALSDRWVERDGRRSPDLVLLGMGDDGHTASLFPDTAALDDHSRSYTANWVDALGTWRLTATFPLLWAARHIIFLVAGEGKAEMLHRILDEGAPYPAQRVAAGSRATTWMVDAAAASRLNPRS